MGSLDDLTSLDGHQPSPTAGDTLWHVFDRLTAYDGNLKPQPMLAESWELSGDSKQIKLNLRKGVQFHNGREMTSDDVKWNVERVRDTKAGTGNLKNQSAWFKTVETPDKYTVVLISDAPRPTMFDFFEYFNILNRETTEGAPAGQLPVGTGPFALTEYNQGSRITFAKNKSYWQSGKPYLDQMVVSVIRDPQALVTTFESGTLDVIKNPPARDFVRWRGNPPYQAVLIPGGRFYFTGANVLIPPLDDKRVRQALAYTLDRKRFVDSVLLGLGDVQSMPWPTWSPAYEASKNNVYSFDLDKAKSLLNAADVTNLELDSWPVPQFPELTDFALIHQADLAKVGVKLNIKSTEQAAWLAEILGHTFKGIYSSSSGYAHLNPGTLFTSASNLQTETNNSSFKSAEYTRLGAAAASETDETKKKQVYSQLNDLLIDEAFQWPMASSRLRMAAQANVHGWEFPAHDSILYTNAWVD